MGSAEAKVYLAILIGAGILGSILVVFIITMVRQQRRNFSLHKSKLEAQVTSLEEERTRIARDLHDELSPVLLAIKYNINSFDLPVEEDREVLDRTNDNIDRVIAVLRQIATNLFPGALLRKGLTRAMEEYAGDTQMKRNIEISFKHYEIPELKPEISLHIYRILQEVIQNTVKHAGATRLDIDIRMDGKIMTIATADDGIGFDYVAEMQGIKGMGLNNISNRALLLGGDMLIDTKAGRGTRYLFTLPI